MQHVDTILRARWLIPVDAQHRVLEHQALVLDCGKIFDILPIEHVNAQYTATHDRYFDRHVIMPGLINAHTHIGMNMMRGMANQLSMLEWLKRHVWPLENLLLCDSYVQTAATSAMAEMIKGGTTCINDMYYFAKHTANAVAKAGMRATLAETLTTVTSPFCASVDDCWLRTIELIDHLDTLNNPLLSSAFGPHAAFTVNPQILRDVASKITTCKLGIHMHVHSHKAGVDQFTQQHGQRPLAYLNELGLCSPRLVAAHMTDANDEDIAILKNTGTSVVHCPESNIHLNNGIAPVAQFIDEGINVALGTDSVASNYDLDMLSEMRSACFADKIYHQHTPGLSPATAIKMATINGAKALGLDHTIGSLEKGKAADVIAINLNQISPSQTFNPMVELVYAANSHQVTDAWIAGKNVMKNRTLTTLNETALTQDTEMWQEKMRLASVQLGL